MSSYLLSLFYFLSTFVVAHLPIEEKGWEKIYSKNRLNFIPDFKCQATKTHTDQEAP